MFQRLIILACLLLWAAGFVELASHTSMADRAVILGRYSLSFFMILIAYASGFILWGGLLFLSPAKLTRGIGYIQDRIWLALPILAGLGLAIWGLYDYWRLAESPMLRFSAVAILLLLGLALVFTGLGRGTKLPQWQKLAASLIGLVVIVEFLAQSLAYLGLMPGRYNLNGGNAHYGRVYYNEEGFANGVANRYGWYYPDFRLQADTKKILLLGDTFIQALQVEPDQNIGVKLEENIRSGQAEGGKTEVLTLGHPGFGPGLYLDIAVLDYPIQTLGPDEIVAFVHLGSDLRNSTQPSSQRIHFLLDEHGNAKVHPDSFNFWHDLAHYVIFGYQPLDPLRTLETHYLTPALLAGIAGPWTENSAQVQAAGDQDTALAIPSFRGAVTTWGPSAAQHTIVKETALLAEPGAGNALFRKQLSTEAQEGLAITESLIKLTDSYAKAKGITFRLVTIPAFPEAFYTTYQDAAWEPEMGEYDLFLPEKELQALAAERGIPFLAMGQYLKENGVTVEEIESFYLSEGTGHFTPQGHVYFAQAVYDCFYAGSQAEGAVASETPAAASCLTE